MNRIRKLRKERGLKAAKIAEFLGVSYQSFYRYEKGERDPSIQMLIKLADFFDVPIDYLVGRKLKNNGIIKNYQHYAFDGDYMLKKLGATVPTLNMTLSVLDGSEFETLKIILESGRRLSEFLAHLSRRWYQYKIPDDSLEKLARILVNKEAFYVEVIERVDS